MSRKKKTVICARCGNCCRWPGYVHITLDELDQIAAFLQLTPEVFTERYTRLTSNRKGLALLETVSGACIFLEGNHCKIQAVKPQQCRDFPHHWQRQEPSAPCQMLAARNNRKI